MRLQGTTIYIKACDRCDTPNSEIFVKASGQDKSGEDRLLVCWRVTRIASSGFFEVVSCLSSCIERLSSNIAKKGREDCLRSRECFICHLL